MTPQGNNVGMIAGTLGGTLLSLCGSLNTEDVVKTAVLAAVGAATSFLVSMFLKWLFGREHAE